MLTLTRILGQTSCKRRFLCNFESFLAAQSLHTSQTSFQTEEPPKQNTKSRFKDEKPVDWLPFPWHRPPMNNLFEDSGDKIKSIIVDPTLPKPGFEYSDELKTASESVKLMFSAATASVPEAREICRRELVKKVQRHPLDFKSLEVQIAEKTVQIRALFDHKEKHGRREVKNSRVILPILIQRRNSLLKKLRILDNDRFIWLLEELQLYYKPTAQQLMTVRFTKKNDLRRLTKEYCQKMIADKKNAYHESLKKEQVLFVEEKKNILAWIEEEEKAIEALNV